MKFLKYNILYLLAVSLFLISCEKEIEIDLHPSTPRLVIEGLVPENEFARVKLTMSKDYGPDNNYPAVTGATVVISDNKGNSDILQLGTDGWYHSSVIKGVVGNTYNLLVKSEGEEYTSQSTMPNFVALDSVYMYFIPAMEGPFPMAVFQDPAGIDNYYRFLLKINNKRMHIVLAGSDEDKDGQLMERILPFNKVQNNDEEIKKGDLISVEMQCIDKGVHKFFDTWAMMDQSLANPQSNIKGGALGYFSAYTSDSKEVIADWEE